MNSNSSMTLSTCNKVVYFLSGYRCSLDLTTSKDSFTGVFVNSSEGKHDIVIFLHL